MKVVVIGAAGHIGTYLIPMLMKAGYETIAVTRSMSTPYEDCPEWHRVERVLIDREHDPEFITKLKAMDPDIIVDLVNFNVAETRKIVENFKGTRLSHYLYCSSCWAHGLTETIPLDPDDLCKAAIDDYGKDKFASEMYLKEQYRLNGFPATMIMPGQISGPGWTIINPWGNTSMRVFQDIADDKEIALPNFWARNPSPCARLRCCASVLLRHHPPQSGLGRDIRCTGSDVHHALRLCQTPL